MIIIKKKYVIWLALILVGVVVLIFMRWNDYREKELVDVLDTDEIEEFIFLHANTDNAVLFEEMEVEDPEAMEDLIDFFGQYRVKKVGPRNFSTEYPDEQFSFQINYQDERNTIDSMIERDVLLHDMDQYTIINGPLDYGWIESFMEKQNLN